MAGPYTKASDPFLLWDLSRPSPVRDYQRWFYRQLAAYLAQGGCEYYVSHGERCCGRDWSWAGASDVPVPCGGRVSTPGEGACSLGLRPACLPTRPPPPPPLLPPAVFIWNLPSWDVQVRCG